MTEEELSQSDVCSWSLESGGYLGEISALCLLHVPPHLSSFPLLLVGTGSEILLYDVELGLLLNSFHVFEGIRVHGISCGTLDVTHNGLSSTLTSAVVVFGEKRVKLFSLSFQLPLGSKNQSKGCAELLLNHILPRFSHWVMDVLFIKEDHMPSELEVYNYLAVGLGDNSVCLWDISKSTMVIKVRCSEKTLLYSMRLWGTSIDSFKVASGTIYNEVIVWKLDSERHNSSHTLEAMYLNRLSGHEGSIFRLAWFPDGSKLMSVSDDRSARIWKIEAVKKDSNNSEIVDGSDTAELTLFGHTARVWDCYISDSLIVTAGEDCTCRVWGMDGKQLLLQKEHTGRGIWRCTYDPSSSLLITAGFDSSVKVNRLHASLSGITIEQNRVLMEGFKERMEFFTLSVPNLSERAEPLTSKSEYIRCLRFTREDSLYVATNNGYLHHVKLSDVATVKWTELFHISEDAPIVCMDLLSRKTSSPSKSLEDWIAVGDGKGNVTVVRVAGICTPTVELAFTWLAETERQLLGTYWCKTLGPSYIFTADPKGTLKLWKIHGPIQSGFEQSSESFEALLTAEFTSCFGTRILCLDALLDEQVLVCGDQRGNLVTFSLPKGLLTTLIVSETKSSPINSFKGAHGISSVTSISVSKTNFNQVGIESTGGDGCICCFRCHGDWGSLEFTGMKQVKELSLVQSVSSDANSDDDLACGSYAVGFASADFIIWNIQNETKVVQVSCGGWRRPHSYYLGDVPESQHCFAYVKDHGINIHRLWVPAGEKKLISHVLHMQHHGREIHSLCFVSDVLQSNSNENRQSVDRCSFIATGCEDGTVRLTWYAPDAQNWFASKLFGEHVGGSAVRSICFVSKMYKTAVDKIYKFDSKYECKSALDETEIPSLLISVGAKRVLTSWLLQKRKLSNSRQLARGDIRESKSNFDHSQRASASMSFQWLSTDMPSKFSSTHKTMENTEKPTGQGKNATNVMAGPASKTHVAETIKLESKSLPVDKNGDDWRYLAVTAFLVRGADCRSIVCFIVVSCSDATLTLRALILPYRLWFDVAFLVPHRSPVLSLQNVILPIAGPSQGESFFGFDLLVRRAFFVFPFFLEVRIRIYDGNKAYRSAKGMRYSL
ncbi:Wd repeat-containing protein [Thalictrum thalictroides]|uniref:Wd repeat-containing protein n=1 Tax=Thalictrum thalictroides TaxID=46969 RepID=A0A7J6W2V2_THATH|nr:Wd repeat-containing protein [Thalictrum thalictroides]